jgi:hypothetical protein
LYAGTDGGYVGYVKAYSRAHSEYINTTPSAWITPTLVNGWSHWGSGYPNGQYRLNGDVVEFRGLIKVTNTLASGLTIFTLPAGYRPTAGTAVLVALGSNGTTEVMKRINVSTAGAVVMSGGFSFAGTSWLSLEGLRFSTH